MVERSRQVVFWWLLVLTGCIAEAEPAALRSDFTELVVADGLASPTAMAFAPDGRLFVCQQGGALRVLKHGVLLPAPFLTVTVSAIGERGLLGVAIDPGFESNQYVYVYYTATTPNIHNRVSRFTANGDVAAAGSEVVLLELNPLSATNHNGGALHFGPDGLLYIGVGENAVGSNAQTLNNLLGKMLRIHADGSIPTGNPFYNQAAGVNRAIWALGLRNPFSFAIDPASGRMLINDVGQDSWEEIDDGRPGGNYGWPATEGPTSDPRFIGPVYAYTHASGGCAISGGAFYPVQPSAYPSDYAGDYFFADFCAGWIRQFDLSTGISDTDFASGIVAPVDLAIGPEGSLYYLARGPGNNTGVVVRIDFSGHKLPVVTQHPQDATVTAGQSVTFRVAATGTPPLLYQWQRDEVDIPGAISSSYTVGPVGGADSAARFRCRIRNDAGEVFSRAAILTVVSGARPVPRILLPSVSSTYVGGSVITYSGSGKDAEDGVIPESRLTWEIAFHHDAHTHPFVPPHSGQRRGSFRIPVEGETSANVWYRIHLTVTDSDGQRASTFRDVRPRVVTLTLRSNPNGMTLSLDGQPVITPVTIRSVVGIRRSISIPTPQVRDGVTYESRGWSDSTGVARSFATPARSKTFTAIFRNSTAEGLVRRPSCLEAASSNCAAPVPPRDSTPSSAPRSRITIGPRRRIRR